MRNPSKSFFGTSNACKILFAFALPKIKILKIPKPPKTAKPFKLSGALKVCVLFCALFSILQNSLYADDLRWAEQSFNPHENAPEGVRNNISLEMVNAVEGLFEPRFQHYFRDNLAYYIQMQVGSDLASTLKFSEEFNNIGYNRFQAGFEFGLSSLIYARNAKITKDTRRWGSGIIMGLGFRFMYSNLSGSVVDNLLSFGLTTNLGFQLQARNFSVSMYVELRVLMHISTQGGINLDVPILQDRGALRLALPEIPGINASLVSEVSNNIFYSLVQGLHIRFSYYF